MNIDFKKRERNRDYKANRKMKDPEKYYSEKRAYYRKSAFAPNGWTKWTEDEISAAIEHEIPDSELSKQIGRSVAAIQMVRYKYNKTKGDIFDE